MKRRASAAFDTAPPHDMEAEKVALGCVIISAEMEDPAEAAALLAQLRPALFYDHRARMVLEVFEMLTADKHALTSMAVYQAAKHGTPEMQSTWESGALKVYVQTLGVSVISPIMFPQYLKTLESFALRRFLLSKGAEMVARAQSEDVSLEDTQARLAELFDSTQKTGRAKHTKLKFWTPEAIRGTEIDPRFALIGDNEISTGYDGVCVIAGPGSSGKSLVTTSLAIAGAIGQGHWMGRRVHRQFRTMIIQAENGLVRLKGEMEAIARAHPDLDLSDCVRVSEPPEGGLRFADADFRRELAREVEAFMPDLVIIDPWSQVAVDDNSSEVIGMIGLIRSCFPAGAECPGLVIVAHTKKPRAEDVRKGRALVYQVSGSIALVNTARTVYMLLPWSDDVTDTRIFWTCAKLNNGANYAPAVWRRRFGTFFEHDPGTDPMTWGQEADGDGRAVANQQRRTVTPEIVAKAFASAKRMGMRKGELAEELIKLGVKRSPAYDGIKYLLEDGVLIEAAGMIAMRKP